MKNVKKVLIIITGMLMIFSCYSQHLIWEGDTIRGKVKSLTVILYKAEDRFGNIEKIEKVFNFFYNSHGGSFQEKYDKKGNLIESNWYKFDGSLGSKTTYKRDEKGNKIEENSYNSDGSLDSKKSCKYDEKGNKIEKNDYNSTGSLDSKRTYKYNEKGNLIEENYYNSKGDLCNKCTYKYDEKGNLVEVNNQNSRCGIYYNRNYKETYIYDEKGNLINKNNYDSDASLDSKTTYKYDKKGKLIEENIINSYNSTGSLKCKCYTYKYDEKGNKLEEYLYEHDSTIGMRFEPISLPKKKYADYSSPERVWYNHFGSLDVRWSYKYEYDEKGNWIKKICFKNEIPMFILERTIEYYE